MGTLDTILALDRQMNSSGNYITLRMHRMLTCDKKDDKNTS